MTNEECRMRNEKLNKYGHILFNSLIFTIITLFLAACLSAESKNNGESAGRSGGAKLKDISVFHQYTDYRNDGDNAPMSCAAWGNFELEDGKLPPDKTIRNGSKKVYKVNMRSGSGGIMFPIHGWGAFSLEQYYENGYIEFDVRGDKGGEKFTIGLRSDTRGKVITNSVSTSLQNIQITDSWQTVKIPIKAIAKDMSNGFSIKNITLVVLEVSGSSQFYLSNMYIKSPDSEKQFPVIKVNQAGYFLNHEKYALVSCFPDALALSANTEFNVIDEAREIKFTGKLQQLSKNADKISGEKVFMADFSQFNESGTYRINITNPKIDDSFKFVIDGNIYKNIFIDTQKYFYLQRQGIELERRYAGVFARKNLHPDDNKVKKYSQRDDQNAPLFDVSRGWYDAGDFGKYFPPAAATVTDLLFAYEYFPNVFRDNQLNIPESGNGVPDILDEVKWQLDMMLKLEDGTTGSFYEVANYEKETIYIVDTDGITGAGNTKSTNATAWAAGVFAHAYIVYKDIPAYRTFASVCLETAKRAWNYIEKNPNEHTWVNGAGRSYYHDVSDTAKIKFLAAAALYRATNEEKFNKYVIDNYRSFNYQREFKAHMVATIGDLGTGFIHYAMSGNPNQNVMSYFDTIFKGFESVLLDVYKANPWQTPLVDWAYFWGSSKPIVRIPVELYICNKIFKRDTKKSEELIRKSVNFILGINPLSFSFISGYGENCVKNIYSGIFTHDNIDAVPLGYLAGGANQYESGFMSNYIAKCYIDSDGEWTTNEHAIYWNAAAVLCLAALLDTAAE